MVLFLLLVGVLVCLWLLFVSLFVDGCCLVVVVGVAGMLPLLLFVLVGCRLFVLTRDACGCRVLLLFSVVVFSRSIDGC